MAFLTIILAAINFAVLTDTHVSTFDSPAAKALASCIEDINALNSDTDPTNNIAFVVHTGDETDFGTDTEEALVHSMLKRLTVPFYAVPGNHDATWSESGSNTFKLIYGEETFCFEYGGWRFVGCPSGPDIRMSPALVSRETLVWLYSLPYNDRTIFFNHYPANEEISNIKEYLEAVQSIGTQLFVGGHHHINVVNDYDGTPGILCRSSLPNKESRGEKGGLGCGYTVITLNDGGDNWTAVACERYAPDFAASGCAKTTASPATAFTATAPWFEKDFCPVARRVWSRTGDANIAAGFASDGRLAFYGTTAGDVKCISISNGTQKWSTRLPGKIFSTPALWNGTLVIGCADGGIYGISVGSGRVKWHVTVRKAVLGSPAIRDGIAYIGASDGVFRAIDVMTGAIKWEQNNMEGHVITRPYVDENQVIFGSWGRTLYSLDPATGAVQWTWQHPHGSRMYSPAACWCVKSCGKVFVAVPDRKVWVFDAVTGEVLNTVDGAREAIGISPDGRWVFSKTMHSELVCIDAQSGCEKWRVTTPLGYDISPTEIKVVGAAASETDEPAAIVIVPTDKGNVFAFSGMDGHLLWRASFSKALVNPVIVTEDGCVLMSSMDGRLMLADPRR